jgi:signal transduction histidine kinase
MLELLVQNSLESVDAGSRVTISITIGLDDRGWIVMEMADDGRGMDPGTAEHAIEPFFTTKPNRFGVGLTIANGIWRRHSGTLSLRSSVDEGTTIRLCIDPQPNPGLLPVDRRAIPVLVESTPLPPASEPSRSSG